jgi:aspartyl-tRNA(Asn)/glutamyl-tRNA(Gln) amidotransferase subunit B
MGLHEEEVSTLTADRATGDWFEALARESGDPKAAAVWTCGEVSRVRNARGIGIEAFPLTVSQVASVLALVRSGRASTGAARQVFEALVADPTKDAAGLLASLGLEQLSDAGAIEAACREALAANAKAVAEYRAGKEKALGAVVGAVMKQTAGRANPAVVQETLRRLLAGGGP